MTTPIVEYADRIVRLPEGAGHHSYRIQRGREPGCWVITDGHGGKTVGTVQRRLVPVDDNRRHVEMLDSWPLTPAEAPLSQVIAAWEAWCAAHGKEPWPR